MSWAVTGTSSGNRRLTLTINDKAAGRIVRRNGHGHAVSQHDADSMPAHLACELGQDLVAIVQFDPKVSAFRDQNDFAIEMN